MHIECPQTMLTPVIALICGHGVVTQITRSDQHSDWYAIEAYLENLSKEEMHKFHEVITRMLEYAPGCHVVKPFAIITLDDEAGKPPGTFMKFVLTEEELLAAKERERKRRMQKK